MPDAMKKLRWFHEKGHPFWSLMSHVHAGFIVKKDGVFLVRKFFKTGCYYMGMAQYRQRTVSQTTLKEAKDTLVKHARKYHDA